RRSKADRDRLRRQAAGAQRADEACRFIDHRDIGVAEPINRLFPVADDEDGWRNRIARRTEAFAPALDELPDQLPLRAAGVLKLVHQHVTVTRLEPEAALRELIHILQQL